MSPLQALIADVPQTGRVRWIGVRPESRASMLELDAVEARREAGLTGDHARPGARNARQVTLIQWEHLAVISSLLGRTADQPILAQDLRRNLVISGINLFSLKGRRFRVGQAILETTGWCQPCARLEQRLGPGTFQAVRGHGGITARVIESGIIRLDDELRVEPLLHAMHGRSGGIEERLWVHADKYQQYRQTEHHDQFTSIHAGQYRVRFGRAEVGAVNHDQRVNRTKHQTGCCNGRDPREAGERAHQNQELTHEVTGAWQAQRRGSKKQADGRQVSDLRPQTTHFTHVTGMQTLIQLAAEDKQRSSQSRGISTWISEPRITASTAAFQIAEEYAGDALVVPDPYLAYARISHLFDPKPKAAAGVHPSAVIAADAVVDPAASIGAFAVIESGARIAAGVTVGPHCFIGARCEIGEGGWLAPRVTLYHDVRIGKRVVIQSGAVLGGEGFGFANEKGVWQKIAQIGGVTIGDDVEIGVNTAIDRGALADTVIGEVTRVKLRLSFARSSCA